MMKALLLPFIFLATAAHAEINIERFELSGEYGLAYHSLEGEQKSNNSKGKLTSPQYPYWNGALTTRISQNWGLRIFGGLQLVRFDEPAGTQELKSERKELINYGLEIITKTGPYSRLGYFIMQQERPLYFNKAPGDFEVIKTGFVQGGLSYTLHQRRRIGLLWGLGAKAYTLLPVDGGTILTEAGVGGETFARLGWIGPLGTSYLLKGFYQIATAPNADITFTHEVFGYGGQINYTF
jgi:hypothetical protein